MELVIWLELPSILIVGSAMVDERKPVSLGETLAATMAQPLAGPPRRPARIRVAKAELAKEVRGAADGIRVVVAPVPELDETFADFAESVEESRPEPSYLGDGEIAQDSVAKLFSAASLLFRLSRT